MKSITYKKVFKANNLLANNHTAAAATKSLQSCPTLCNPIDGSPPGSTVPGILQAKNTGVGCHFLLQCMKVKGERSRLVMSDSLQPHGLQPTRLLHPWDFPGQEYWSGVPLSSPENSMEGPQKLKIQLLYDLVVLLLGIYPKKTLI